LYDTLGRREAVKLPLNKRSGMTYDEVGNLKTMTDFNGKTITYIYDYQNRLTEKQFQDGSKVQYGYTLHGLQDTVTFRDSTGLITSFYDYDYDVRDRLVKRTDTIGGTSRSIQYGYDQNSNQTSVTTASGITTYSYDERDRLDLTRFNGAIVADYDYDAGNRLTKTTFGNGTEEVRVYDTLNRLKELTSKKGAIELSKYVYTLDKVGNRKTATESVNGQVRSVNYTYDDLYHLTDEAIVDGVNGNRTSGYTYDNVGNRLTKTVNGVTTTYSYDGNDRLLNEKVGGAIVAEYSYDNNGSTLTKMENGVTTTYTWNDEKRLVSATVGTQTVDYVYNDQGIRVSSKQNGVEMQYLLDEGIVANVWEEYAPDGTVQASYVYGNDLITQTQAGQTSYYLVDGLGSTRLLTDTQGQVLNSYGYEAFGQTVSQSGTADNKYQYAGEQFDAALGDYYLRQRFYDTSSGRFGRMDTWEGNRNIPSTLHKYSYVHNNPVTGIDPTGLFNLSELTVVQRLMLLIGTVLLASQATDTGRDLSGVRGRSRSYNSMDEAGIDAIKNINSRSIAEGPEFGGVIAQSWITRKFFYTSPKRGKDITIQQKDVGLAPLYARIVADYHTHGRDMCGFNEEIFSDDDVSTNSKGWNGPNYWPFYGRIYGYLGTSNGRILKRNPWQSASLEWNGSQWHSPDSKWNQNTDGKNCI
jgi:RHS repeat-associated protein